MNGIVGVQSLCPTLLGPHGLQPARLFSPGDFPGKNTAVGCHFLLQGICPTQVSSPESPTLAGEFFTTEPPEKPMNGISVLQKCLQRDPQPFHRERSQREDLGFMNQEEALTQLCWHRDCGCPASRSVRNTSQLLISYQVCDILLQQPERIRQGWINFNF